ncbi:MAG: DUF1189 domain-containing protein [Coprococcus sp.]
MEEEYNKVSMADQIAIAVSSPKNYKHLTKLKTGKIVAFMFVITFLLVFIEFGINVITFMIKNGGFRNLALNRVPQFTYDGSILDMDSEFEMAVGELEIYIDTEKEKISIDDIKTDGAYIAIGGKNMVMGIVIGGKSYEYMNCGLSMLFPISLNNDKLAGFAPYVYVYIVIMYAFYMVGKIIKMLFYALIFSIIANALANNFHTGLTYGQVLKICIYGITLAMLISSVNMAAGYLVSETFIAIISVFISFTFISKGVLSHADLSVPPGDIY